MHRYFINATLRLLLPIIVLVFGVSWAGRNITRTTPDLTTMGFGICDLPCWAGMQVGVSSAEESIQLAQQYLALQGWQYTDADRVLRLQYGDAMHGIDQAVLMFNTRSQLERVYISGEYAVQPIFEAWGAPSCARGINTALNNGQLALILLWEHEPFSTRTILLYDAHAQIDTMRLQEFQINRDDTCATLQASAWRGFAPFWWYTRLF